MKRLPMVTVFLKEVKDSLRDRRTALMVFVASVLTGPVTLVLVAQYISGIEEKSAILKVRIAGQEHAPALVNFLQRNDVEMIFCIGHRDGRQERMVFAWPLRYFFRYEIEHLLARCGFRITALYGNFDRAPIRDDSPEMIFVAETRQGDGR